MVKRTQEQSDNLDKWIELLEGLDESKFDMERWVTTESEGYGRYSGDVPPGNAVEEDHAMGPGVRLAIEQISCGTAACALGWAASNNAIPGLTMAREWVRRPAYWDGWSMGETIFSYKGESACEPEEAAADAFGLTLSEAESVIYSDQYYDEFYEESESVPVVPLASVIERLKNLREYGDYAEPKGNGVEL